MQRSAAAAYLLLGWFSLGRLRGRAASRQQARSATHLDFDKGWGGVEYAVRLGGGGKARGGAAGLP